MKNQTRVQFDVDSQTWARFRVLAQLEERPARQMARELIELYVRKGMPKIREFLDKDP